MSKRAEGATAPPGGIELLALLAGVVILLVCVAALVYVSLPWLRFRADLLTWSEPGFVGNIMRLSQGVPIYGPPGDNNSVIYTPGAPILTYAILKGLGQPIDVPALRYVQAGFVLVATFIAVASTYQLRRLIGPVLVRFELVWLVAATLLLGLAATAPRVNRLVLTLHADALALVVSSAAWLVLLWYVRAPSMMRLAMMACIPALGFLVKQFLIAWLPVTVVVLACLPYPGLRQRVTTVMLYAAMAGALLLVCTTACSWIWGEHFRFWAFEIMGGSRRQITLAGEFNVALFRSLDHVISAWWELAVGMVAGAWLIYRRGDQRLMALMAGWVTLVAFEALTSGSGFSVVYHFGPAVLIGTTVAIVALQLWSGSSPAQPMPARLAFAAAFILSTMSIAVALGVVPTRDATKPRWFPGRQPDAVLAQVSRIEQEFAGLAPEAVLIDHGNWAYLRSGHIALDRAEALGDQPPAGLYQNFEPLLERIRTHHYRKIIVRSLHEKAFMYDWWRWHQPSGVRQALFDHYEEIAVVPAADGLPGMFDSAISILVPKQDRR